MFLLARLNLSRARFLGGLSSRSLSRSISHSLRVVIAATFVCAGLSAPAQAQSVPANSANSANHTNSAIAKRSGEKAVVVGATLTQAQCSNGTPSKVVTHLSTEGDGTGTPFISALIARNITSNSANFFVCGFAVDGTFIGGTSVTLAARSRMFATSAATPLTLTQLLGGAALGSRPFQIWLYDSPGTTLFYEYGFVGNQGQFLAFAPLIAAPYSGTTSWVPSHVGADGFFNTLFYLSNASTTESTTFSIEVLDDDGGVLAGGVATGTVPARGRAVMNFAAVLGTLPLRAFYGVRIRSTNTNTPWSALRVITYPTTGVGGGGVSMLPQF
jgi:hypothetical protein